MLERYTHPTEARKIDALETFDLRGWAQPGTIAGEQISDARQNLQELLGKVGGRQEARTPDLRVANAALSQLS